MKVKVKKQKKEFKPIKMEIVFESQEEINDLYNRVNSIVYVEGNLEPIGGFLEAGDANSWEIYEQLKKLI
tara:strand:- start:305 stop:514 length:210 start_codon:yes stop_codon:yes gene_type:complete